MPIITRPTCAKPCTNATIVARASAVLSFGTTMPLIRCASKALWALLKKSSMLPPGVRRAGSCSSCWPRLEPRLKLDSRWPTETRWSAACTPSALSSCASGISIGSSSCGQPLGLLLVTLGPVLAPNLRSYSFRAATAGLVSALKRGQYIMMWVMAVCLLTSWTSCLRQMRSGRPAATRAATTSMMRPWKLAATACNAVAAACLVTSDSG
jgi:hypothetical protein